MRRLLGLTSVVFFTWCHAATITAGSAPFFGPGLTIRMEGRIEPGDAARLSRFAALHGRQGANGLLLDSTGGDFREALVIGRWVRKSKLPTVVWNGDRCIENCVFVLAGGVTRLVTSSTVVLMRPTLAAMPPEGVARAMRTRLQEARDYMEEMNLGPDLAEAIFSAARGGTPLTAISAFKFGLQSSDPAYEEEKAFELARRLHMTRLELARRERLAAELSEKACGDEIGNFVKRRLCYMRLRRRQGLPDL